MSDWLKSLQAACNNSSQSKVSSRLRQSDGFPSKTIISQALTGNYPSAKGLERLEALVEGAFMNRTVSCPVLGILPLNECMQHQGKPFAATNRQRVELYRTCRMPCEFYKGKEDD